MLHLTYKRYTYIFCIQRSLHALILHPVHGMYWCTRLFSVLGVCIKKSIRWLDVVPTPVCRYQLHQTVTSLFFSVFIEEKSLFMVLLLWIECSQESFIRNWILTDWASFKLLLETLKYSGWSKKLLDKYTPKIALEYL